MPILDVTIVLKKGEVLPPGLAAEIADAVAAVFGSSPGRTWVRLGALDPHLYAEDSGGPPEDVAPVFVSVLKAEVPPTAVLQQEAERLTMAVAGATRRPSENVHIIYEPPARGRIYFGGQSLVP